jgi:hypothetical protein
MEQTELEMAELALAQRAVMQPLEVLVDQA